MTRMDVGGLELAVRVSGPVEGAPVLVLHGFTGSGAAMAPLTGRLTAAADSDRPWRLIAPDLVGHGGSEAPEDPDRYSVEAMAEQATALACALDCETFHLVGYSMGGRVALTVGCTAPKLLRSLTLIGATAGIAEPQERRRRAETDAARAERITADFAAFVDEWMADPLFAGQAGLGPEHLRTSKAQRLASNPEGLARSLRHGGTGSMPPLHRRLSSCDTPTLLVAGADDAKFCAIAETLASGLGQATVERIVGAGHAAHLERPAATAAAVAAFIARAEQDFVAPGARKQ